MADITSSYNSIVGTPINASGGGRPGGDQIAISFAKGKPSTKQQLDELAIQKAKLDIAQLQQVPVGAEQQRYSWEAENQRLSQEAAARQASAAAIDLQQRTLALQKDVAMTPLEFESQRLAAQTSLQNLQQHAAMAPGELAAQQSALKQAKITNPLDVQAKQLGITGAQAELNKQKIDEFYRTQSFRDTHQGMDPNQFNKYTTASNQDSAAALGPGYSVPGNTGLTYYGAGQKPAASATLAQPALSYSGYQSPYVSSGTSSGTGHFDRALGQWVY